jgi:hypothetical protein
MMCVADGDKLGLRDALAELPQVSRLQSGLTLHGLLNQSGRDLHQAYR